MDLHPDHEHIREEGLLFHLHRLPFTMEVASFLCQSSTATIVVNKKMDTILLMIFLPFYLNLQVLAEKQE